MMWPNQPRPARRTAVEGRADGERQAAAVAEEGKRERHHGVDRPGVEPPMEDGRGHADGPRRLDVLRIDPERRVLEMIDRLQDAEEHQPDAHAGREQHREPAEIAVVGLGIRAAEADLAVGRDDQEQAEQHEDVGRHHEQPVEGRGQPGSEPAEELGRPLLEHQNQNHEADDDDGGDEEHRIVEVETEDADVVLADLVVGLGLNDCAHSSNSPIATMNRLAQRDDVTRGASHPRRHRQRPRARASSARLILRYRPAPHRPV